MTLVEPQRKNPIVIRLNEKRAYVVLDDEFVEPISLEEKATITSQNYGMTIFTADGGKFYYKTQSNIISAAIEDDYLVIYEEGKSIPWKINKNGLLINSAKFDAKSKGDVDFVRKNYGLGKREIPSINDYESVVEYDVTIDPKLDNPLTIMFNDERYKSDDFLDKNGKIKIPFAYIKPTIIGKNESQETSLEKGVMYDPRYPHYGFKVISARKSKVFATQCRITGAEIRENNLVVYEEGKQTPWKIDINVDVIDWAKFLDISRRDVKYLEDNFGLSIDDVEEVNSYGLKYVNEETK